MSQEKAAAPAEGAGFETFSLDPRILSAIARLGFTEATPIQAETIPKLLAGHDIVGRARTGSGKTAAFGLPLIERVKDGPKGVRALVLAPTRELALQVTTALESFAKGLRVKMVTVYGGSAYKPQFDALNRGVPVVIGTPGRIIDHLERGSLDLSSLELLVLDEADEMLRMGFIEDVERVLAASPETRQVALFSATMPPAIRRVAQAYLKDPIEVQVEAGALTTEHIEQRLIVVPHRNKLDALTRILAAEVRDATLIFARTRAGCAAAADELSARGFAVDALHGDLSQNARELVLKRLRNGRLDILVATDVASRGIDVDRITHVINLDLPDDHEAYVHRIGRTGRAGRKGVAISLATPREVPRVKALSRALRIDIEKVSPPSDAEIDRGRRSLLAAELTKVLEKDDSPAAEALRESLEKHHDDRSIAVAALTLLAGAAGIDLGGKPSEAAPSWARTRQAPGHGGRGDRGDRGGGAREATDRDGVELFIPVGKARGINPADIVGALTNEFGAHREQIGRITILPHKTFLRVHQEVADRVLDNKAKLRLRGKEVLVVRARPRQYDGGPRPRRGGPDHHGRGNGPPRRGKGGPRRFKPKKR